MNRMTGGGGGGSGAHQSTGGDHQDSGQTGTPNGGYFSSELEVFSPLRWCCS